MTNELGLDLSAIQDEDELDEKFASAYGLNIGNEWWYEGYEDELQRYHNEWSKLHGVEKMNLTKEKIADAQKTMEYFCHRTEEVVNLMFTRPRWRVENHGDTLLSDDGNTVTHYYWDGYDAEPFDNCSVDFPFAWLNMSSEELKKIRTAFWAEVDAQREKAENEREAAEKEMQERDERAEYERLKAKFEPADVK